MNVRHTTERSISLPVTRGEEVAGDLALPGGTAGIVLFAHGSGSSRHSSRNRSVAAALQGHGFATLLFDLLTPSEERRDEATGELRFDITLLATRVRTVLAWIGAQEDLAALPIGLFGASTGAAAALVAAAENASVRAVVSRGGRPDLAGTFLERVAAPTLLLVGSLDTVVLGLNRDAFDRLAAPDKELVIVHGAGHLFEEPGTLEQVAQHAAAWFERWLAAAA